MRVILAEDSTLLREGLVRLELPTSSGYRRRVLAVLR